MIAIPKTALFCMAGASLVTLAGLVGRSDAHETSGQHTDGLRCLVVTHDLGDAVEISGKVTSDHTVHGVYTFNIRQSSGGGQAVIDQSGPFSVDPSRTTTLGQAVLGGVAQGYRAELELTVSGKRLTCSAADTHKEI